MTDWLRTPQVAKPDHAKDVRRFLEHLLLLFIGLKLARFIDWPWWLVLSPFLGPLMLAVVAFVIVAVLVPKKGR